MQHERQHERRRAPRAKVNLAARWQSGSTQQEANVTSLSLTGFFALSGGLVETKELIQLELTFPDGTKINPWAEVVDKANEIGFAAQFTSMEDEEFELLIRFVARALVST